MPLKGFKSLCDRNAAQIVSRDKGNPQYHKGINPARACVTHYKIDGTVMKEGDRCDYLLLNEERQIAYLIELKGSDLVKAARQLEATEKKLRQVLSGYSLQYRIVANKCKTQEIRSVEYRKYQIRWKGKLIQRTGFIEENI
ncbi:MAG: hypothetical protein HFI31_10185 [Lachnospiraceae bacterium]|jgi:hypothetical protein|nr:hypothetical protein [Lachnospiraceae bacterium]MCI8995344.1 hypothetical protein [Lachnospiraceae bacterium]MCI9134543.1 hypothetical protein [Lachnospiraceae bacterium]